MKKSLIILFACFLLFISAAPGQNSESPNALAFRWTYTNYQLPVSQKLNGGDYNSGAELTYIRHLNPHLNLAMPLKLGKARFPLNRIGDTRPEQLTASLDALLQLKLYDPEKLLYPYLLAGAGLMTETKNGWNTNVEFPVGLGLNLRLAPHLYLSLETQYRFDLTENRNSLQHAAGIWLVLGGYHPKDKTADSDKDGLPDAEDQCPDEPGTAALFGCPDRDGDGIANRLDDCPDEAGLPKLKGCPDRDGDGIANYLDNCPDMPGPAQLRGCPDTDGDGIIDPDDKCPNTPGPAANQGCPELKPAEKEVLEYAQQAVQFETGKAALLPSSRPVLTEIVELLKKYPDHRLRISGHTDSIGTYEENEVLSEQRARACYNFFVNNGITPERLSFKGYGETQPIADNMFEAGRAKNRRVVFEIYVE
ncbi:MAG: hypothetical protein EPO28_09385 [Saprospiraceae bacterium]|nr:MAG: hypothetical protein EPO28_09385 [Saprospiraceae bacterium]